MALVEKRKRPKLSQWHSKQKTPPRLPLCKHGCLSLNLPAGMREEQVHRMGRWHDNRAETSGCHGNRYPENYKNTDNWLDWFCHRGNRKIEARTHVRSQLQPPCQAHLDTENMSITYNVCINWTMNTVALAWQWSNSVIMFMSQKKKKKSENSNDIMLLPLDWHIKVII